MRGKKLEKLLQRKELATNYSNNISVGLSFTLDQFTVISLILDSEKNINKSPNLLNKL